MVRHPVNHRDSKQRSSNYPASRTTFERKNRVHGKRPKRKRVPPNNLRQFAQNTRNQISKTPERQTLFGLLVSPSPPNIPTARRQIALVSLLSVPSVSLWLSNCPAGAFRQPVPPTTCCGEQPRGPQITRRTDSTLVSICTGRYSTQAFTTHLHSPLLQRVGPRAAAVTRPPAGPPSLSHVIWNLTSF
jgi:hypothetical protein